MAKVPGVRHITAYGAIGPSASNLWRGCSAPTKDAGQELVQGADANEINRAGGEGGGRDREPGGLAASRSREGTAATSLATAASSAAAGTPLGQASVGPECGVRWGQWGCESVLPPSMQRPGSYVDGERPSPAGLS